MEIDVMKMEQLIVEVEEVFKKYEVKDYRRMLWSLVLWDMEEETIGKMKDYNQYRRLVDTKMEMELQKTLCGNDE